MSALIKLFQDYSFHRSFGWNRRFSWKLAYSTYKGPTEYAKQARAKYLEIIDQKKRKDDQ